MKGVGGRLDGVEEIKEAVKLHFEEFFKKRMGNIPVQDGIVFKILNEQDFFWLERPFSEGGVKGFGMVL